MKQNSNIGYIPSSKIVFWMFYFLTPQWHHAVSEGLPSMQHNFNYKVQRVAHILHLTFVENETLSHVSGELNHKRCWLPSALWPHSPCFLLNCFLISAAEMSMPDAPRCWQDILRFWRAGMFYPSPITHVEWLILNWKYTLKSWYTHRLQKFQNINKWKKHLTAWISVSRSWVRWVAFAQGVARRGMLWVLIVYSVSINCNTPSSICQG